ncbi:MAG: hypothetical protein FWD31_01915 [Planctomycetaceae bacterium]|nr:hypothetical protein [Planctomycetaceae bacterium]
MASPSEWEIGLSPENRQPKTDVTAVAEWKSNFRFLRVRLRFGCHGVTGLRLS